YPLDPQPPRTTLFPYTTLFRSSWINKDDIPTIYRTYRQAPSLYASLVLRTAGDPRSLVHNVRSEVVAVDPELSLYSIKPLDEVIDRKSTRLNSSHDQISYAVFC